MVFKVLIFSSVVIAYQVMMAERVQNNNLHELIGIISNLLFRSLTMGMNFAFCCFSFLKFSFVFHAKSRATNNHRKKPSGKFCLSIFSRDSNNIFREKPVLIFFLL